MNVHTLQLIWAYDEAGGIYYTITDGNKLTAIDVSTGATTKVTINCRCCSGCLLGRHFLDTELPLLNDVSADTTSDLKFYLVDACV